MYLGTYTYIYSYIDYEHFYSYRKWCGRKESTAFLMNCGKLLYHKYIVKNYYKYVSKRLIYIRNRLYKILFIRLTIILVLILI